MARADIKQSASEIFDFFSLESRGGEEMPSNTERTFRNIAFADNCFFSTVCTPMHSSLHHDKIVA
jgi:hypothetical protein